MSTTLSSFQSGTDSKSVLEKKMSERIFYFFKENIIMTLSTETASTDLKTIFYKKDYISQGPNGQVKRLVATQEEIGALLRKYDRDRWFLMLWMGNGDVPAIPKCLIEQVHCPGLHGNRTTTTYFIRETHQVGMSKKLWEGQTDFEGTLIEQVNHSSRYSSTTYDEPFINSKAPEWLIEIGMEFARNQWRMDFDKRFPKEVAV